MTLKFYQNNQSYCILMNPQIGLQKNQQSFVLAKTKLEMLKGRKNGG